MKGRRVRAKEEERNKNKRERRVRAKEAEMYRNKKGGRKE